MNRQWHNVWRVLSGLLVLSHGVSGRTTNQPFDIVRFGQSELVIAYHIPPYRVDTLSASDGTSVVRVQVDAETENANRIAGAPMVQTANAIVALPSPSCAWSLTLEQLQVRWIDIPLAPYPQHDKESQTLQYDVDRGHYQTRSLSTVTLSFAGIARGVPLGRLSVPVIDYDPSSARTRIIERCTIRVLFNTPIVEVNNPAVGVPILNISQLQQWLRQAKGSRPTRRGDAFIFEGDAPIIRVSVDEEGIYAITADQLAKIGIQIPQSLIPTIKLYGYGGRPLPEKPGDGSNNTPVEQPLLIETNADGSLRTILFYAQGTRGFAFDPTTHRWRRYLNPYTTKTSYLLTWGGRPGLRYQEVPPPDVQPTVAPRYFVQRLLLEQDRVNAYASPSGRRWLGDPFDATTGLTLTAPLPGIALNAPSIEYGICVVHKEDSGASIAVSEHGTFIREVMLPGRMFRYGEYVSVLDTVQIPISLVSDGRMVLRLSYRNSSNTLATGLIDYVEVHYPALFTAQGNALHIYTEPTDTGVVEYSVAGFDGRPLCIDITDPVRPQLCSNTSVVHNQATFRVVLDSTQRMRPRQFYISAERRQPELVRVEIGNARNSNLAADMIVVAPLQFVASAEAFARYRAEHSRIAVVVVPVEHIYNAYAAGMPDPTAIRDFLSFTYFQTKRRPRYVLFWGDGHYDYRGITTTMPNWIPPYENDNVEQFVGVPYQWSYADDTYVTEDYFGCVDGDDPILDIAVGRLPITSDAMGNQMAEKIRSYETRSLRDAWQTTVTLVADDGPTSNGRTDGALHVNSSETLSAVIANRLPGLMQRKVYLPEYPMTGLSGDNRKPAATEAMLSIVNGQGTLILNWMGHGNPRVWAHEGIFDRDRTMPLFRNARKNVFVVAATCDFARFDMTDAQSGAEALIQWTLGGSIGVFSAARVVYTIGNEAINRRFYEELSNRNQDGSRRTLGDIMLAIKQRSFSDNDRRYLLLGDPSLKLLLPDAEVTVDTIEHVVIEDTVRVIACALSQLHVSGTVRDPITGERLDSFNGTLNLTLFDADVSLRMQDQSALSLLGDATYFQFGKLGGVLHRGNYSVTDGQWAADFIIPKDVTLSEDACRMHMFAFDNSDSTDGMGVSRALRINCVSITSIADETGPKIALYVDSRRFMPGDLVRSNPVLIVDLWDESGINMAGIGIGHKIEAWLDDNLYPIDLTEFFESWPHDSRGGTVQKQLFGLSPGIHTLRVRAWDVWNNYSETQTWFVTTTNDSLIETGRIVVVPQPFSDQVTITYNHNQSVPVAVTLTIAQIDGRIVWRQDVLSTDVHSASFVWNGCTADGQTLPAGVYTYTIVLRNSYGSESVIRGFLVKVQ